jgi:hypothetical protein
MKALENLSVDEYYMTITTWLKIIDEKNKSVERMKHGGDDDGESKTRKKFSGK